MGKMLVRKATTNGENIYLEVPQYFKSFQTYNKVIDSETIISLYGMDGKGMFVENSISETEYRKLTPIDESQFNEIYQKHLNIVQSYV
jgi:hypothetical protein